MTSTTRVYSTHSTKVYRPHNWTLMKICLTSAKSNVNNHSETSSEHYWSTKRWSRGQFVRNLKPFFTVRSHKSKPSVVRRHQEWVDWNNLIILFGQQLPVEFPLVFDHGDSFFTPRLLPIFAWTTVRVAPETGSSQTFMSHSRQSRPTSKHFKPSARPTLWNTRYLDLNQKSRLPVRFPSKQYTH